MTNNPSRMSEGFLICKNMTLPWGGMGDGTVLVTVGAESDSAPTTATNTARAPMVLLVCCGYFV